MIKYDIQNIQRESAMIREIRLELLAELELIAELESAPEECEL